MCEIVYIYCTVVSSFAASVCLCAPVFLLSLPPHFVPLSKVCDGSISEWNHLSLYQTFNNLDAVSQTKCVQIYQWKLETLKEGFFINYLKKICTSHYKSITDSLVNINHVIKTQHFYANLQTYYVCRRCKIIKDYNTQNSHSHFCEHIKYDTDWMYVIIEYKIMYTNMYTSYVLYL